MGKILLLAATSLFSCLGIAKQIAITIDDSPRRITSFFNQNERPEVLLKGLKDGGAKKALFFANTYGLKDPVRRENLLKFANAGHFIGNHTHRHMHPHKLGAKRFLEDTKIAKRLLQGVPNLVPYFRYPFLDYGKTVELRDEIRAGIKKMGYTVGYVTIDNSDWYMDKLLQDAVKAKKKINFNQLKKAYVHALWEAVKYYDEMALKYMGRSPKHTILLHENDLTAMYVKDFLLHVREKGWEVISPLEAFTDPLVHVEPKTLIHNNGRVAAVAYDKGHTGSSYDPYQPPKNVDRLFKEFKVFSDAPNTL